MKIRKQVYELTLDDLSKFPVWEFALDEEGEKGQDEATVRPCEISGPLDPCDGMFIVCAEFTLADGSKMQGYLTPQPEDDSHLGTLQPVIITERGQVVFWYGAVAPDSTSLAQSYERLGRKASGVFPIQVTSNVELVRPPVRATIPGFMAYENLKSRKTKIMS
ncbi:MAG: hypothetical protein ABSA47_04955 [Verrucomicrobiota bacterium]|jgi:hypothetical protein